MPAVPKDANFTKFSIRRGHNSKSEKERKKAIGTARNTGWYVLNFYISHYQGGKQEKTQGDMATNITY